jgi:hypothetical protein
LLIEALAAFRSSSAGAAGREVRASSERRLHAVLARIALSRLAAEWLESEIGHVHAPVIETLAPVSHYLRR